jgi:RNA polymerase sigma factor (sigma-70 family)
VSASEEPNNESTDCDFRSDRANHRVDQVNFMAMTNRQNQLRFEALLREHRKIIFKVVAIYARETADRNDLAQEICVQLWRSFGSYDEGRSRFSTWMYRIALNVAISKLRRDRKSLAGRIESLDEVHLETIAGDEPISEENDRLAVLYALIGRLDALNRALILLYLEERTYAEIADILGISETNVATKINRIKQKFRGEVATAGTMGG